MKELRYLLFSNEELYLALTAALRARNSGMLRGFLKNLTIGDAGKPDISVSYVNDKGVEQVHRFDDQDVVSALIVYCRQNRIPLSAKAAKSLEMYDGTICLLCKLTVKSTSDNKVLDSRLPFMNDHDRLQAKRQMAAAARIKAAVTKPTKTP